MTDTTDGATALQTVVDALKNLKPEERLRTLNAAKTFFGDEAEVAPEKGKERSEDSENASGITRSKKSGLSADEVDAVFHFDGNGGFDLLDVPGRSTRDKTLHAYILTGFGKYLATGERAFDDATARGFCETLGCYDQANHASTLKTKHPEFTGDKKKGYSLTNPGIRRGAALVKEVAGAGT